MRISASAASTALFKSRTFVSLRRHHNYRLYFSGQFLSLIGTWLLNAAMAWQVLQMTHSAFAVGVLAFWQFGPYAVLGLFGGVLSDRFDHRKMLEWSQIGLAICSSSIAILTLFHVVLLWEVYMIAAVRGVVLVFNNPSRQAFIFQMVGREELPNAIALNSSVANATRIIGPGLGGLLIAAFGVGVCYSIDAISYAAVILALMLMRLDEIIPIERHGKPTVLKGIAEGLRYVWRTPTILLALTMFTFICTVSINFTVLLPLVASNTLGAGAEVFGLLTACFGAGALIGALISASLGRVNWRILLISALGFGIGEVAVAPQHSIIGAVLLLIMTGVFYTIYTSNTNAIVQLASPGYLQGRVAGLYSYIFSGSNALGALIAGGLAAQGGTELAFLVAGGTVLVLTGFGALMRLRGHVSSPEGTLHTGKVSGASIPSSLPEAPLSQEARQEHKVEYLSPN